MVFKNQLTPLSNKGPITKHEGKGSQAAAMPDRREIKQLAKGGSINDYAKATPTVAPLGSGAPFGTSDLG